MSSSNLRLLSAPDSKLWNFRSNQMAAVEEIIDKVERV
jgi:hypothetical protein